MNETPFHIRIKKLREQKGLTKVDVAKGVGISATAYHYYEIGRHRPASIEIYWHIAKVLGCELSYLTFDDERISQMEQNKENMAATEDAPAVSLITFGQKLKRLRESKGMARNQVADLAGIAHSTYGKYECDNNLPLHEAAYDRLAEVLGCEVSYLKDGAREALMALHDSKKEFGRRIRSAREAIGIGLTEFADKVGIPGSTMSNYETGYSRPKDVRIYDILADALNVDAGIFKELDPRFALHDESDVNASENGWETISGVYADDDLPELKPLKDKAAENSKPTAAAENGIKTGLIKEDKQEDAFDPETKTDPTLRPADLMYEIMKLTSRLSALLAGNRLTREEKDIIKASLDMAYQEGIK